MALYRCTSNKGGLTGGNVKKIGNVENVANNVTGGVNVSSIFPSLYNKLTVDNFLIVPNNFSNSAQKNSASIASWRTCKTEYQVKNILSKSYNPGNGVLSFNLTLYEYSWIEWGDVTCTNTQNVPCNIYVYHPDIKSKSLYLVGTGSASGSLNLSNIEGYKSIWTTDIFVALDVCNRTSNVIAGTSQGHGGDSDEYRTIYANTVYSFSSSYNRNAGRFNYNISMNGEGKYNTSNDLRTRIVVIQ